MLLRFIYINYHLLIWSFEPANGVQGGKVAIIGEYPFMVTILNKANFFGTGVLISREHILTSGRTITLGKSEPMVDCRVTVVVTAGLTTRRSIEDNLENVESEKCFYHPKFNGIGYDYDLVIVYLASKVSHEHVVPISAKILSNTKLAESIASMRNNATPCYLVGWNSSEENLRVAGNELMLATEMTLPTEEFCEIATCRLDKYYCSYRLSEREQICVKTDFERLNCPNSIGLPLICNKYLWGILATPPSILTCSYGAVVTLANPFLKLAGFIFLNDSYYYKAHKRTTRKTEEITTKGSNRSNSICSYNMVLVLLLSTIVNLQLLDKRFENKYNQ